MDVERFPIIASPSQNAPAFRRALLSWYRKNGRDLPWRRTRDPYPILVSEIMLQQTQVATVLPYYERWLRRFPDFPSLARASESDILHAWQGLGYYARARNLHAAAKAVVARHRDRFPMVVEQMRALPGLGRYTANAVATFAFDQPVPIVETNIARLLARILNLQEPIDAAAGRRAVWNLAADLVPRKNARDFNSALMDLGALLCTARLPKCHRCPVGKFCRAVNPTTLPRKKNRTPTKRLTENHAFIRRPGHILLEQSRARWRGMWILPRLTDTPPEKIPLHTAVFPFTHHRITLVVFRRSSRRRTEAQRWFPLPQIKTIPMPSPHRRALAALLPN